MNFGRHLRAARKAARMTGDQAEFWSGVPRSHISDLERNKHEPRVSTLIRLADAYGVMLSHLVGEVPLPVEVLTKQERAVLAALRNYGE